MVDILKKKIIYQSSHRGCKETDFILGEFVKNHLHSMKKSELDELTKILSLDDDIIYDWVTLKSRPSEKDNTKLLQQIINSVQKKITK